MLLPLLAFVFGSLIIAGGAIAFMPNKAAAIDRRLEELTLSRDEEAKPRFQSLIGLFKRIGEKVPRSPKEMGPLRLRLVQAGFRREEAITIFFGIRVMFALALFMFFSTSVVARPNMTMALAVWARDTCCRAWCWRALKRRAQDPPVAGRCALDLLVVLGSGTRPRPGDVARVASELAFAYPQPSRN
jgi:hypothetical protein